MSSTVVEQTVAADPADLRRQWDTEGYVLVRQLIAPDEVARLLEICDHVRRVWSPCDVTLGKSMDNDSSSNFRHLNHPAYFRDSGARGRAMLVDLLDACADPRVVDIARAVFKDEPFFYSTTYWFNPRLTSNGNWHRDSQFVTHTDDEERAMLFGNQALGIQVQIPLVASEDTEVVPRSHLRWDTPEEYRIRKADGCKNWFSDDMPGALRVSLQPGDAVAFNPFALHRGRYHSDKTRRTLMLTYTSASSPAQDTYFSQQPWTREPGYLDGVAPATRTLFDAFIARYAPFWDAKSAKGASA